jgi:hypothetical protein
LKITNVTLDERDVSNIRIALANMLEIINKREDFNGGERAEYLLRNKITFDKFKNLQFVEIEIKINGR